MIHEKVCPRCGTITAVPEPDADALCLGCEPALANDVEQAS